MEPTAEELVDAAPTPVPASLGDRAIAWFIDVALVGVVQSGLTTWVFGLTYSFGFDSEPVGGSGSVEVATVLAVAAVLSLGYHVAFLRLRSATPGKLVMGLRVRRPDGGRLGTGLLVRRWLAQYAVYLGSPVAWLAVPVSLYLTGDSLWALRDPRSRTWHDLAAGTEVVRAARSRRSR